MNEDQHENKKSEFKGFTWVTIDSFYFETKAALTAAKLEDAGIPTFVANTLSTASIPISSGGIKLKVPEGKVKEAIALLTLFREEAVSASENEDFREATKEDILFMKEVTTKKSRPLDWIIWLVLIAIALVLLRAFLRGQGVFPIGWDPF